MLLGYPIADLALLVGISLLICITVCTFAMEAAVLFTIPFAVLARIGSYFVSSSSLLALFGILLVGLSGVLYYSHEHGGTRGCMLCGDTLALKEGKGDTEYCCTPQAEGTGITDGGQPDYAPRTTFRRRETDGETLLFDLTDKGIKGLAGVLAGLLGIAVGELTNTMLTVRKRLPVQLAVGTAAFVLHATILAALLANLAILRVQPLGLDIGGFSIPLGVGAILAPTVIVGGQIGSLINSKMSEETAIRTMIVAYMLVGLFVIGRILVLGGGATH